jgi:hypothetical protein
MPRRFRHDDDRAQRATHERDGAAFTFDLKRRHPEFSFGRRGALATSPMPHRSSNWGQSTESYAAAPRNEAAGFYEKPSEQATREKAEAARRARKQAIRDGLITAPKKKQTPLRKDAAVLPLRAKA